jgi:hypothetical protein
MFNIPRIIFLSITQRLGKKTIYGGSLSNAISHVTTPFARERIDRLYETDY